MERQDQGWEQGEEVTTEPLLLWPEQVSITSKVSCSRYRGLGLWRG